MGSKLAYVMRSTLDNFKLSMHVEIITNLAKLSKERQKGKECKPVGYTPLGLRTFI